MITYLFCIGLLPLVETFVIYLCYKKIKEICFKIQHYVLKQNYNTWLHKEYNCFNDLNIGGIIL